MESEENNSNYTNFLNSLPVLVDIKIINAKN